MKASLKFRDEQKPLLRAKVPLSIAGFPFQSGIVAGESKELTLNLSTFFESGPSIKLAYRPNDSWNPFSLVIKTGTGHFGSPVSSSMLMSAEFNLLGNGNPSFMLHFKPQFGDFSIKKSQSSSAWDLNGKGGLSKVLHNGAVSEDEDGSSIEVVETPQLASGMNGDGVGGGFYGKRILSPTAVRIISGAFSGVEVAAKTRLPVRSRAVMNFRWGLRVPADGKNESAEGLNFRNFPFLVMNKIGIEHVDNREDANTKQKGSPNWGNNEAVVDAYLMVKKQLEFSQAENGTLKKALDDLRQEMDAVDFGYVKGLKGANVTGRGERKGNEKKGMESVAKEELKKASKGAGSTVGA